MESLLVEEEVLSRETRITAEKRYNFWSDRWIVLKQLPKFPETHLLLLPMEALPLEEEVLLRQKGKNSWKAP